MSMQPKPDDFVVTVRDERVPRAQTIELLLTLSARQLTARDLIAERVRAECDARLLGRDGQTGPVLIEPDEKESTLNGTKAALEDRAQRHVQLALEAFESNAFILLVDDRQVETLDEALEVRDDSTITFLRLTALVGG